MALYPWFESLRLAPMTMRSPLGVRHGRAVGAFGDGRPHAARHRKGRRRLRPAPDAVGGLQLTRCPPHHHEHVGRRVALSFRAYECVFLSADCVVVSVSASMRGSADSYVETGREADNIV